MRAVKSVSIDSERRVIITYLDGSTETLYPNCIWCDSEALRQLIKDLLEEKADAITQTIENVTIATFADGADEAMIKKLLISIDPIQAGAGDPSPDNVRPISGRQGVKVYLGGKDILSDITMENGFYAQDGTPSPSAATKRSATFIPVKNGDIFTIRFVITESTTSRVRIHEYDENQNWVRQLYASGGGTLTPGTYTYGIPVSPDAKYVRFSLPNYTTLNVFTNSGDIDVDFGQTIFGGMIDAVSGKLTVNKASITYTGASSESWRWDSTNFRGYTEVQNCALTGSRTPVICNIGKYAATGVSAGDVFISSQNNSLYYTPPSTVTDLNSFTTWLSDHNLQIVYGLSEPIKYQLEPHEITTLLGDNNIWVDSGNLLELEYTADTKLYIGEQQSGTSGALGSGMQSITKPDIQSVSEKTWEDVTEAYKEEATDERGEE